MSAITIRIGTRSSQLALWQAQWVEAALQQLGAMVEIIEISTQGDQQQSEPIAELGLQGVFTKEIQAALLRREIDLAVHSLKDLPTETVPGLALSAVPERENCSDALVSPKGILLENLPPGARVGTGSLRRQAQLRAIRGDLQTLNIRGNVGTRLEKLDGGEFDAIVLAVAGLRRLGWESRITEDLGPPRMLPAPGQGALGIECRQADEQLLQFVSQLDHLETRAATDAERAMLARLHAGCSAPVGAWGHVKHDRLWLEGLVASLDGTKVLRASGSDSLENAQQLGSTLAQELLNQGAERLIQAARSA